MQPLVLAIEPDLRQAAIVKRIVREKVMADVAVVDSRDAALEAMRTSVPDVLLVSTLLSPRDEDELIAHLRTLEHAEHLQTHTIPQLASSIGPGADKPARGLLSSLWRRKGAEAAPAGCDPDLFADEIRTYLQRATEKKREIREAALLQPAATPVRRATVEQPRIDETFSSASAAAASSWSSPFEWRPSGGAARASEASVAGAESQVARPESVVVSEASSPEVGSLSPEPSSPNSEALPSLESIVSGHEFSDGGSEFPVNEYAAAEPEPVVVAAEAPVVVEDVVVRPRLRLVTRHVQEWWYLEGDHRVVAADPDSEWREVIAGLSVPLTVAVVSYADGCRIRRVRLNAA